MATLEELQQQLATLKEKYSEVIEGSYSYEESIATIAVNMQEQLDDAQAAASSAGTYAAIAENAADEAAVAGAEAGATAGASAAQTKYDDIFTQAHTWQAPQTIVGSLTANMLKLCHDYSNSSYSITFQAYEDDGHGVVSISSNNNPKTWLDVYSANCTYVAANTIEANTIKAGVEFNTPIVNAYSLRVHARETYSEYVLVEASTNTAINDLDLVLNFKPNASVSGHALISAYSAGFKYISAYNAINAPDVLAGSRLILGAHLANGGSAGPSYDGRGTVLKNDLYLDHNYVTLQGAYFPDESTSNNVYLSAYSADFEYLAASEAISVAGVTINSTELQQLKDLASAYAPIDYYADSYFENLWADKRTDDIYIRRIYKFAYNPAPFIEEELASCPPTVPLALKDKRVRTYTNALYHAFNGGNSTTQVCRPATDSAPGYDPIKDLLVGFWERCNYYKDSNGDVRITAVNGDGAFDKRKADVGTFGPTLWFDIRDSLEMDSTNTTPMYTEIIVSTAPHPELGLHPHPLSIRSDGTVAPYWCCSAYPAGAKDYELVSAYGSNLLLNKMTLDESYTGSYDYAGLSLSELVTYFQNKGQGYGGGVYINFLVQLMFLLKYGTKNSQSVFKGSCALNTNLQYSMEVTNDITKGALGYNMDRGARWLPLKGTESLYSFFLNNHAVTISIEGDVAGDRGLPDNDTPLPVLDIKPANVNGTQYYKVFLETDYSIILDAGDIIRLKGQTPPAGTTDRVLSKYDGVSGYSAWDTLKSGLTAAGYDVPVAADIFGEPTYPFRIHGIEYGVYGEIFMDKWYLNSPNENKVSGYYKLPWENKEVTDASNYFADEYVWNTDYYGADYSSVCIAPKSQTGYDYSIVIGLPTITPTTATASSQTGLCDICATLPEYSNEPCFAAGWGSLFAWDGDRSGLFAIQNAAVSRSVYSLNRDGERARMGTRL